MIKHSFMAFAGLLFSATITFAADGWRENAVKLAVEEPKIHEALWSQDLSFWVSVVDDGTKRNGYAQYLCFVLNDAGRPKDEIIIITVWDRAAMAKNNLKELGKATCQ